jgi:hypothetical protein
MYLFPPNEAGRECTHDANEAMYDVRAWLREVASIDDDTLDDMDDAELASLAREFAQPSDLFTETIQRTGMDTNAAAKLSTDTLYLILSDMDTAEEEYARWAETIAR